MGYSSARAMPCEHRSPNEITHTVLTHHCPCRLAYRHGVTLAVTAPLHSSFLGGLSAAFSLGSPHKLEDGAIVQDVAAVHIKIAPEGVPSVSTQIAALRNLLLRPSGDAAKHFEQVINVGGRLSV